MRNRCSNGCRSSTRHWCNMKVSDRFRINVDSRVFANTEGHDEVMAWKYFPHHWLYVTAIHRSLMALAWGLSYNIVFLNIVEFFSFSVKSICIFPKSSIKSFQPGSCLIVAAARLYQRDIYLVNCLVVILTIEKINELIKIYPPLHIRRWSQNVTIWVVSRRTTPANNSSHPWSLFHASPCAYTNVCKNMYIKM